VNDLQKNTADNNELVQCYINALINLVAMERAKFAANQSEETVMSNLNSLGASNGIYITPADIPQNIADRVVGASVNAHLTKLQSEQIAKATKSEVAYSETETKNKYINKKVTITRLIKNNDSIEAVLVDKLGNYRVSNYTGNKITGTITDISFEKNVIVIKPTKLSRLITPNRIQFHAYVINLDTMQPNINITF
jgi:hypothetical protein